MRRNRLRRTRLAQCPDVIDDIGPKVEHLLHHGAFVSVNRDRNPQAHGLAHDREHTRQLFFQRYGRAAGAR